MKRKVISTTFLLICLCVLDLYSQSTDKDEKKLIKDAEVFFDDGDFASALPLYRKLIAKYPQNPMYNFCVGVSYLSLAPNETEQVSKDRAIPYLEIANLTLKMNDINYYLGYAYHMNYQWDKAIGYYEIYLDSLELHEPYYLTPLLVKKEEFARIERKVEMCKSGKIIMQDTLDITFVNMGTGVNSKYPDYAPAISADNEVLIFTSRRPSADGEGKRDEDYLFYEDIYITYKVNGKWVDAIPIGHSINTKKHNASIGLSADAQTLFVYGDGDIYMSVLEGLEWSKPKKLGKAINTSYWETHITMTSAQNTIYFVSDRKGGYGGRDIYRAYLLADGTWGRVENLGPTVNTPFDEEAPFIHPDERTLYFSSNGHNSMGGFDIFLANLKNGVWDKPQNMGYPISTPGDDIYFTISSNGKSGYMSTIRKGG
ncbi:MAG: PD40 domain-containing protein, partial [Flavobacteriales bacterium]|nr:PD40 domain-containing protein [Flavobacteriales bacterium]